VEGKAFGRYRLQELLGRGGMGEVWRAHDTATNRIVAIKVLPPHLVDDDTFVERFRREAETAAKLNNPHVIPIHNYGEIDGRLYVDMRLVEGRDLATELADGPLDPQRTVMIIEHVAKALYAAHRARLVHRDVKPSNILVDRDDFAYLIDFGIARGIDQTGLTDTGGVIGTWHYMAPERLSAREPDARSDIYALACVLHECLTGRRPFPGDSIESQVAGHLTTPPPEPSGVHPDVPAAFDAVIAKGMAKNPDDRQPTATQLAADARRALSEPTPRPVAAPVAAPQEAATDQTVPSDDIYQPPPAHPTVAAFTSAATTQQRRPAPAVAPKVQSDSPTGRTTRRQRVILIVVVTLVLLVAAGMVVGRQIIRSNYYVGERDGAVSIFRGVPGSILGVSLQEPYRLGCLNYRNELALIPSGGATSECRVLRVDDLKPSERAQIEAGLPTGTLDDAISQLTQVGRNSVLPICASERPVAPPNANTPTVTALPPAPQEPGTSCRTFE
jgi:serine/threonine protein kinase